MAMGSIAQQQLGQRPRVKSPVVNGDGSVTFNFYDPSAQTVSVFGDFKEISGQMLELTKQDVLDCSHQGACDEDCERVAKKEYVQKQLQDVSNEAMLSALAQMGVEVEDESNRKDIIAKLSSNIESGSLPEDVKQECVKTVARLKAYTK